MSQRKQSHKKQCLHCKRTPNDILMLSCEHSICLDCAYQYLIQKYGEIINEESNVEIQCFVCLRSTQVEQTLFREIEISVKGEERSLQSQSPQMQANYRMSLDTRYSPSPVGGSQNCEESSQKKISSSRKQNYFKSKQCVAPHSAKQNMIRSSFCLQHEGYQLLYFCKKCQTPVCPQCLLHGAHKGHQNKSLRDLFKRQFPELLKGRTENLFSEINRLQSYQNLEAQQFSSRFQEIQRIRSDVRNYYRKAKENILQEENQVLGKCEQILRQYRSEEQRYKREIQQKSRNLAAEVEYIKGIKQKFQSYLLLQDDLTQTRNQRNAEGEQELIQFFLEILKKNKTEGKQAKKQRAIFENLRLQDHGRDVQILSNRFAQSVQTLRRNITEFAFPQSTKQKDFILIEEKSKGKTAASYENSQIELRHQKIFPCTKERSSSPYIKKRSPIRSLSISPYKQESVKKSGQCRYPISKASKKRSSNSQKNTNKENRRHHINQFTYIGGANHIEFEKKSKKDFQNLKKSPAKYGGKSAKIASDNWFKCP